jgi:hypothetical protein
MTTMPKFTVCALVMIPVVAENPEEAGEIFDRWRARMGKFKPTDEPVAGIHPHDSMPRVYDARGRLVATIETDGCYGGIDIRTPRL